jgi:hypothetical protein
MEADERDILIHNCFNEVLNGLPDSDLLRPLIGKREKLEHVFSNLETRRTWSPCSTSNMLIAEVIDAVLMSLGEDDFETRIGFTVEKARTLATRLRESKVV